MFKIESPIERLNYFNGQRLEAKDLRLEQSYHIRVRRWLNRALYSWGIAVGLEVVPKEGDKHKVVVKPGLALDVRGREIILLEDAEVQVVGMPSPVVGVVFGNYLVIEYSEDTTAQVEDGCAVHVGKNCCKENKDLSWGGPSRIRSEPKLSWQDTWPAEDSGKIILAQVELEGTCAVRDIHTFVRKYAGFSQAGKVRTYALEGEKDIDSANPKRIYFHIRGGRPDSVTLFLRGEKFSSLHYTELGRHTHGLDIELEASGSTVKHHHKVPLGNLTTSEDGEHGHGVSANCENVGSVDDDEVGAFEIEGIGGNNMHNLHDLVGMNLTGGAHSHSINAGDVQSADANVNLSHSHTVTTNVTEQTGLTVGGQGARTGSAHTYIKGLQVWIDNVDCTTQILQMLKGPAPAGKWDELGNGNSTHALVTEGTGPIQLEFLGLDLVEGEHFIDLKIGSGGGRILYNLYVE